MISVLDPISLWPIGCVCVIHVGACMRREQADVCPYGEINLIY